jgi:hypothetical protein
MIFLSLYLYFYSGPEWIQDAEIGKAVRESLKCHMCKENLIAPVYTCPESHLICGYCYPNLDEEKADFCYCSQAIIRFPGIDRTVELVHKQVRCKYWEGGCTFMDNGRSIMNHVRVCEHRYSYDINDSGYIVSVVAAYIKYSYCMIIVPQKCADDVHSCRQTCIGFTFSDSE